MASKVRPRDRYRPIKQTAMNDNAMEIPPVSGTLFDDEALNFRGRFLNKFIRKTPLKKAASNTMKYLAMNIGWSDGISFLPRCFDARIGTIARD